MGRPRKWVSDAERMAAARAEFDASEALREQAIRDRWGYGASETRTQAERAATAERIVERMRVAP